MLNLKKINTQKHLVVIFWLIALMLGAIYAWFYRHSMNPDGISYLDIGDAYLHCGWKKAINGYWSFFYSGLLGLTMYLLKPTAYWEFTVVHLVNFLVYVCALASFQFFMSELLSFRRKQTAMAADKADTILPDWIILILGYTLFIWSSLHLITVSVVTPDMCNAAFVYLASGILLYLKRNPDSCFGFVILGLVLGFSYLTRAIMLPLSFIFLGLGVFLIANVKRAITLALIAVFCFLLIAGPYITALSYVKGHLTFGDTGKLAYACCVNNVPFVHWQGEPPGSGTPKHPSRRIFDNPEIYEFSSPIEGTYPVWYDPSYWLEGVVLHFDLRGHLKVLGLVLQKYYNSTFFSVFMYLILGFIFYLIGRRKLLGLKDISEYRIILVPAVTAISICSLVHLEERYIGVFFVLILMGLFSGLHLPKNHKLKRLIVYIVLFISLQISLLIGIRAIPKARKVAYDIIKGEDVRSHIQWQVANGLKKMGIQPREKVAIVGTGLHAYWARLARVKIVAEIIVENDKIFWALNDSVKSKVLKTLTETGAKLIVAQNLPSYISASGWQRIGNTDYYVYVLEK